MGSEAGQIFEGVAIHQNNVGVSTGLDHSNRTILVGATLTGQSTKLAAGGSHRFEGQEVSEGLRKHPLLVVALTTGLSEGNEHRVHVVNQLGLVLFDQLNRVGNFLQDDRQLLARGRPRRVVRNRGNIRRDGTHIHRQEDIIFHQELHGLLLDHVPVLDALHACFDRAANVDVLVSVDSGVGVVTVCFIDDRLDLIETVSGRIDRIQERRDPAASADLDVAGLIGEVPAHCFANIGNPVGGYPNVEPFHIADTLARAVFRAGHPVRVTGRLGNDSSACIDAWPRGNTIIDDLFQADPAGPTDVPDRRVAVVQKLFGVGGRRRPDPIPISSLSLGK